MTDAITVIGVLGLAYLLGSIPFGLLLSRMGGLGDIRETGSGNIGATNVLRSGNKFIAALTLLTDIAKAIVAILVATEFVGFPTAYWAGLAALLGHIFPVWLGFKGGKGVAVFIGTSLVISPLPGLTLLSVWLLVAVISRRSSLAALIATISVPIYMVVLGEVYGAIVVGVQVGVIYWAHRENISRLIKGEEPRIGQSA
ncbi:MAG: glycerol-3-phosphate 1-O-acyltransferase [Rhizobiales bacterium TMED83]|jgi:glycerol-3-phosphate acyltransferase PlsY|nr:acyl-phosphate glycerol 3-phosphate acyltransferase [Rhodobiaceae bacterium]RPF94530.1 MAG: glycerol-3-phosphate 1-O-acyltransferase [Rhizobiales bacterium TMED83]HCD16705.1 acyl-phosphate glycerol 3-phosphate acyltransferase [Rhodobiaceae bacterium]